jgi:hypothetical protein
MTGPFDKREHQKWYEVYAFDPDGSGPPIAVDGFNREEDAKEFVREMDQPEHYGIKEIHERPGDLEDRTQWVMHNV